MDIFNRWTLENNIVDRLKLLIMKRQKGAFVKLEVDALQKSIEEYKISHILDTAKARGLTERAGVEWDEWEPLWAIFGYDGMVIRCNNINCGCGFYDYSEFEFEDDDDGLLLRYGYDDDDPFNLEGEGEGGEGRPRPLGHLPGRNAGYRRRTGTASRSDSSSSCSCCPSH